MKKNYLRRRRREKKKGGGNTGIITHKEGRGQVEEVWFGAESTKTKTVDASLATLLSPATLTPLRPPGLPRQYHSTYLIHGEEMSMLLRTMLIRR